MQAGQGGCASARVLLPGSQRRLGAGSAATGRLFAAVLQHNCTSAAHHPDAVGSKQYEQWYGGSRATACCMMLRRSQRAAVLPTAPLERRQ